MLRGRQVDGIVLASAHGSGNTDMLQQLTHARHDARDDRPRRSPERRSATACSPTTSASAQLATVASAGSSDAAPSRTSAARRSCTPSAARKAGATRCEAHGIKPPDDWIVRGGFMESDGYRSMKRLLDGAAAHRRGVRRQRSVGDRRDEGDLGGGAARARRTSRSSASATSRSAICCACRSRPSAGRAAIRAGTPRSCCSTASTTSDDAEPQRVIIPPQLIVRESSADSRPRG